MADKDRTNIHGEEKLIKHPNSSHTLLEGIDLSQHINIRLDDVSQGEDSRNHNSDLKSKPILTKCSSQEENIVLSDNQLKLLDLVDLKQHDANYISSDFQSNNDDEFFWNPKSLDIEDATLYPEGSGASSVSSKIGNNVIANYFISEMPAVELEDVVKTVKDTQFTDGVTENEMNKAKNRKEIKEGDNISYPKLLLGRETKSASISEKEESSDVGSTTPNAYVSQHEQYCSGKEIKTMSGEIQQMTEPQLSRESKQTATIPTCHFDKIPVTDYSQISEELRTKKNSMTTNEATTMSITDNSQTMEIIQSMDKSQIRTDDKSQITTDDKSQIRTDDKSQITTDGKSQITDGHATDKSKITTDGPATYTSKITTTKSLLTDKLQMATKGLSTDKLQMTTEGLSTDKLQMTEGLSTDKLQITDGPSIDNSGLIDKSFEATVFETRQINVTEPKQDNNSVVDTAESNSTVKYYKLNFHEELQQNFEPSTLSSSEIDDQLENAFCALDNSIMKPNILNAQKQYRSPRIKLLDTKMIATYNENCIINDAMASESSVVSTEDINGQRIEEDEFDEWLEVTRLNQERIINSQAKAATDEKLHITTYAEVNLHCQFSNNLLKAEDKQQSLQEEQSIFSRYFCSWIHPPQLHECLEAERDLMIYLAASSFNNDDDVHDKCLRTIYTKLTNASTCNRFGPHWEDIGFQGFDPATDLRGAGFLSLVQLIYFVESPEYSKLSDKLFNLSNHKTQNFPFCLMSISMTRIAMLALKKGNLNRIFNARDEVVPTFHQFYVAVFSRFYSVWLKEEKTIVHAGFVIKDLENEALKRPKELLDSLKDQSTCDFEMMLKSERISASVSFTDLGNVS